MAKVIATISGIGLVPGISKNRRLYTPEMVERATKRLDGRIKAGNAPANMLSFHGAGDNSREITATLTGARLDEGRLRFDAAITATRAGEDIATLADTTDGKPPHLKNVSIRGWWLGAVRKVKGPDGQPAETADDVDVNGIDWTKDPGVTGAEIDTFAWVKDDAAETAETTERILITESVQEARVTITEETGAPAWGVAPELTESFRALLPLPHILENGICVTCEASPPMSKRGSGLSGAGRQWADPGYQDDKKQRYDLTTKANAKAAWTYINQPDNAKPYSPGQLKRIKGKIKAALKRFGVTVAAESADWGRGETWEAAAFVPDEIAEHYGDPSCSGSWSVSASNGPVNLTLCSYGMDPEDLDKILRAAADAACKALAALDPDMDGDVDVPGVGSGSDPDNDAPGESALDHTDPAAGPAAATTETEGPVMTETTTPAAGSTPATDQNAALAEAVTAALAAQEDARRARKAAKREAREKAETEAARIAQESAALGQGIPATAGASATETEDQRRARLRALVDEQFATAAKAEGLAAEKTDEQLVAEMIEERMVPLRQARAEGAGVQRKGLAPLEAIADGPGTGKLLEKASNEELSHLAAAAFGPRRR